MRNSIASAAVVAASFVACTDPAPIPDSYNQDAFIEPDAAPVDLAETCADNPDGFGNFALPVNVQAIAARAVGILDELRNFPSNDRNLTMTPEANGYIDNLWMTGPAHTQSSQSGFGAVRVHGDEFDGDRRIFVGCVGMRSQFGDQGVAVECLGINAPEDYDAITAMTEADLDRGTLENNGVLGFFADVNPFEGEQRFAEFRLQTRFDCGDVSEVEVIQSQDGTCLVRSGVNQGPEDDVDLPLTAAECQELVSPFYGRLFWLPYDVTFDAIKN